MNCKGSMTTTQQLHLNDPADLMTQAALALHQDAAASREMARDLRQKAREDGLERHQQAAEKLREMARSALGSAILQGATTLGSAALSLGSGLMQIKAEGLEQTTKIAMGKRQGGAINKLSGDRVLELVGQSKALIRTSRYLAAGGQGCTVLAKVDPLSVHRQHQAAEKMEIDNRARQAEDRAKEMGDQEAEARRLESSSLKLMQQLHGARHVALMTATRG